MLHRHCDNILDPKNICKPVEWFSMQSSQVAGLAGVFVWIVAQTLLHCQQAIAEAEASPSAESALGQDDPHQPSRDIFRSLTFRIQGLLSWKGGSERFDPIVMFFKMKHE